MIQEEEKRMKVEIRPFNEKDIPLKVEWINDSINNKYLHYDLPLREDKTLDWFKKNKERTDRYDATIEADGIPVGLIGLLDIDRNNHKAEYYITIGNREFLGKGVAYRASRQLLEYAFCEIQLNKVVLYTEYDNVAAQKLFEKVGFKREGLIRKDIFYHGKYIDRYLYSICKEDYLSGRETPIYLLDSNNDNQIYVKRDDLFPFSFGGNKARKGMLFWKDIKAKKVDYLVTYGSSSSNHCRIIANIAASEKIPCCIISPEEIAHETYNRKMMEMFGAKIVFCEVSKVHDTIEEIVSDLEMRGFNPYFIQGGGHGNLGTQAYVNCYEEIRRYEMKNNIFFDYIFLASGTGTTQAGLICGKMIFKDEREIVGISVARKSPYGANVVKESIRQYFGEEITSEILSKNVIFEDSYVGLGYGQANTEIRELIFDVMKRYGMPLDSTYTGKAFWGMKEYLLENKKKKKNVLFLHTGGTPLYFDELGFK